MIDKGRGHLPASEEGAGIIPEDEGGDDDVHLPESESGAPLDPEETAEPQSWPGKDYGTIPPPG